MVVVDQGKRALGKTIEVTVTSVLQTTAGKMIFCRWPEAPGSGPSENDPRRSGDRRSHRGDRREANDRAQAVEAGDGRRGVENASPAARTE
jgi:hypothetical protein